MKTKQKEFNREKSKACLVVIDDDFKMEALDTLNEKIGSLLRNNYKFFYFIYNNTIAKEIHSLLLRIKSSAKCVYPHFREQISFNANHFDSHFPLPFKEVDERISWAEKSCDAVLTTKNNKFNFKKQVFCFQSQSTIVPSSQELKYPSKSILAVLEKLSMSFAVEEFLKA